MPIPQIPVPAALAQKLKAAGIERCASGNRLDHAQVEKLLLKESDSSGRIAIKAMLATMNLLPPGYAG